MEHITKISKTKGDLSDSSFRRQYWTEYGRELLTGAKIVGVEYLSTTDTEVLDWNSIPVLLTLKKDGKTFYVFPSCDDEGNDGGALFFASTTDPELAKKILPTITK
jgi:hypothetical protein